jgi:hypothetical protein
MIDLSKANRLNHDILKRSLLLVASEPDAYVCLGFVTAQPDDSRHLSDENPAVGLEIVIVSHGVRQLG